MTFYRRIRVHGAVRRAGGAALGAAVALGALQADAETPAVSGPTATGQICMQKVFMSPAPMVTGSNKLNCTANDIRLSRALAVSPSSCIEGESFDLTATFETNVTANARYDAGFYFRTDGGSSARGDGPSASGVCSLSSLSNPPVTPGLKLDPDSCGDLNAGTYTNVTFTIPDVLCKADEVSGELLLPNCTSWHSSQSTSCNIAQPVDFDPDTKSKCVCDDTFTVPVIVETPSISVQKDPSPGSVPETGEWVTFTVVVANDAQYKTVTISSLWDDVYGDLFDPNNQDVEANTCLSLMDVELTPGGSAECSFKGWVSGNAGDTPTSMVDACIVEDGICAEDDADVLITDVAATPTLSKEAKGTANCSLEASYEVVVTNSSAIDTLTVNSLVDDKFGDITKVAGNVVSTTCPTLPFAIGKSSNLTCEFVGRITSTSCDFSHTNVVTGGLKDSDGVASSPSDSAAVTVTATP